MSLRLGQIVEALGGVLHGSPDLTIDRLSPLDSAGSQSLSFLSNPRYVSQLSTTQAACVIVGPDQAAQAQALLQEMAEQDLQQVGNPPAIKTLQQLSEARQSNVLRHWLALEHSQASAAQLQALLVQVKACTTRGHHIDIKVGRGFVRRDGAVLRCYNL